MGKPESTGSTEGGMNKIDAETLKKLITVPDQALKEIADPFMGHALHDAYATVEEAGILLLLRAARTAFHQEYDFVIGDHKPREAAALAWENFCGSYL
jgi:hypothetical protein